jgi:hypothetical protein
VTDRERQIQPASRGKPDAQAGSERQQRYRAAKAIRSIDLPEDVLARIRVIRDQTGLRTAVVVAQCLDAFEAEVRAAAETRKLGKQARGKKAHAAARSGQTDQALSSPGDASTQSPRKRKPKRRPKKPAPPAPKRATPGGRQTKADKPTGKNLKADRLPKKGSKAVALQGELFTPTGTSSDESS